jgi:hypothetical protein
MLSSIKPNDLSAIANSNSNDDNSFLDIDKLLASPQQKSVLASAKPNYDGTPKNGDGGTRIRSPVNSSRSIEESTQGKHITFLGLGRNSYSSDPRSNYT